MILFLDRINHPKLTMDITIIEVGNNLLIKIIKIINKNQSSIIEITIQIIRIIRIIVAMSINFKCKNNRTINTNKKMWRLSAVFQINK